MKIGFLIESLAVSSGGPARVAGAIASELARRGHLVSIGTLPQSTELVSLHSGITIKLLGGSIGSPFTWFHAAFGIRQLSAQVDVLFVSGIWGPVDGLSLRLARIRHIPIHTRICGMLEEYILMRHPRRKMLGRLLYLNANLRRSSSLLVNTPTEKSHVVSLGFLSPVRVIPNGVCLPGTDDRLSRRESIEKLGLFIPQSSNVLLYLSRIHPKKGLHLLLQSLSGSLSKLSDWHLVIAGDFSPDISYQKVVTDAAASSCMTDRIHFVGEVSGERKRAAFSLADMFVLPSQSEGFSNAVIEAMSWGIPVVITEGCNFPEVSEAGAGWVVLPDVDSLRSAIVEATSDLSRLRRFGSKALSLVHDNYQLSTIVDMYEELALSVCT